LIEVLRCGSKINSKEVARGKGQVSEIVCFGSERREKGVSRLAAHINAVPKIHPPSPNPSPKNSINPPPFSGAEYLKPNKSLNPKDNLGQ
jgi:hypothetical protein